MFIAAEQHADSVREMYADLMSSNSRLAYRLPDGLCVFHDTNLVVFGTVWLPGGYLAGGSGL